jgi:hypothetical protein
MYNEIYFKQKILRYGIPILFLLFFAYIFYSRSKFKSNYDLTSASVTSVGNYIHKNGNSQIEYVFIAKNGDSIFGHGYFPVFQGKGKTLISRSIPVAYSKTDINVNQLLIYKNTWKQFGLVYPDSLDWIRQYIDVEKIAFSY